MARSHPRIRTYPRRLTEHTLHTNSQATHHHHNKNNKSNKSNNNSKRRYDRMPTQVGRTHPKVTLALPRGTYHPYKAPIWGLLAISHLTSGRT
jgi:hypothetical protein